MSSQNSSRGNWTKVEASLISIEAVRHAVYAEVISSLAPASLDQTRAFMANLALPEESLLKFLLLRVSPGSGEVVWPAERPAEILWRLERMFGKELDSIAGFYRGRGGRLCWNLPGGCSLYGYRSTLGFFNGILCQPLTLKDKFWLLSSSKYGGAKAIRLTAADAVLFEAGVYQRQEAGAAAGKRLRLLAATAPATARRAITA
jgi:hypothetical protein